jgi:signal transduction histidine kinase/CheY-like chemotaxis protein
MLFLSGACAVLIVLTLSTKTLSAKRRMALVYMQTSATMLLIFDRFAYMYRGDVSSTGYWMVRVSNFMVFLCTLLVSHSFNLYMLDLLRTRGGVKKTPFRFYVCEFFFTVGVWLLIISQFTGLYYTFDSTNRYVRSPGFVISYLIPTFIVAIQFSVAVKYRRELGKDYVKPLILFTGIPFIASILQIFAYGFSLINITSVGLVVLLYFFEIKNINKLREAKDAAERANSAKSRFLVNISHEIRTPINTIMGMNEMIKREDTKGVPKEYVNHIKSYSKDIHNASDMLLCLVNDILDISQIEAGNVKLVENTYDLTMSLKDMLSQIKARCVQKGIDLKIDIDESIPNILYGDEKKIRQTLTYLLNNAVKYTDEGEVSLKMEKVALDGKKVSLRVLISDTGVGIKPEVLENLFSNMKQLEDAKSSSVHGTKLGLDISKYFVDMMGGTLNCTSEYGKGSCFEINFDQRVIKSKPIGKFKLTEDSMNRSVYIPRFIAPEISILVVDDNPMNLSVIKGLLAPTRMYITTVLSGEECIEKIKEADYNMVLLDHMMPGMDGIETIREIRKINPELPVIALTANYIDNGEEYYRKHGFNGYLPKPVNGEKLERTIRLFLPDEVVMDVNEDDILLNTSLPAEYAWLNEVELLNTQDGIAYCGGVSNFIDTIKMFYDSIDDNSKALEEAFDQNDIKMYTIKVHALKTAARIIGAKTLSDKARALEDAGKEDNWEFIELHHQDLMIMYRAYLELLDKLNVDEEDEDSDKGMISEADLQDAYEALRELVDQMDYDAIEMVLASVAEYRLPDDEKEKFKDLNKYLKLFDWDKMEEILKG